MARASRRGKGGAPTFLVTVKHLDFAHNLKLVLALHIRSRLGRRPMFFAYLLVGAGAVGLYILSSDSLLLMVAIFPTAFSVNGIFAGRSVPGGDHRQYGTRAGF